MNDNHNAQKLTKWLSVAGLISILAIASYIFILYEASNNAALAALNAENSSLRTTIEFYREKFGCNVVLQSKNQATNDSTIKGVDNQIIIAARDDLPSVLDPTSPTKSEVRKLFRFFGLFDTWHKNPNIKYDEGDVSYWADENLSWEQLVVKFETRYRVLKEAESTGEKFESKGDVSWRAEELEAEEQNR